MRIAILGAGFAGLASAWYLLYHSQGGVTIDLFDPLPIGKGTSGISSGLLHLYAGKHAKRAKDGEKKLQRTNQLFSEASRAVGGSFVLSKGILRPTITEEQIQDFKKAAVENSDVTWWEKEKCEEKVLGLKIPQNDGGGLFIPDGLTIDVEAYLEGLWKACALLGTQFHQRAVTDERELQVYDRVLFALGAGVQNIKSLSQLPVEAIKGQALIVKWPSNLPPTPFSLVSEGYLIMGKDYTSCTIGSTYERSYKTPNPEPEVAIPLILKKIAPFFPDISQSQVIDCKAGIRAASKNAHLPLLGRLSERHWFFTGLGSKGLLYHAYLGDLLAQSLLQNDSSLLPPEFRYGI